MANLAEKDYMDQSSGFIAHHCSRVWFNMQVVAFFIRFNNLHKHYLDISNSPIQEFWILWSEADCFYQYNSSSQYIFLVVYLNNIVITNSDHDGIK